MEPPSQYEVLYFMQSCVTYHLYWRFLNLVSKVTRGSTFIKKSFIFLGKAKIGNDSTPFCHFTINHSGKGFGPVKLTKLL